MHARFARREIRDHREFAVEDRLAPVDDEVNDAFDARDADTVDRELDIRFFFLAIGEKMQRTLLAHDAARVGVLRHGANALSGLRVHEVGCYFRERNQIEGPIG
jgi:hypothetical protein